ncbi:tRNA preQ1(34) S-adenosylmethionine ribosyltransferase-isomerase QueA [candidate division KSB1 bacterium]|nr:tRNA preQ1(34) S-adenosylmethionine ribosyltransferase-isomerase QueA [candidate division KSB1 bacterium]
MTTFKLNLSDYDYHLPPEMIAQYPCEPRDLCKLMCIDRQSGAITHGNFRDILEYVYPNDVLVLNDTRVFPARIFGNRSTGARIEILLLKHLGDHRWQALVKPGRRFRKGDHGIFADGKLAVEVTAEENEGIRQVRLSADGGQLFEILDAAGHVPLPPYIDRPDENADRQQYQTVYAHQTGSVAAPTAGLHFTEALLTAIEAKGISVAPVTLHVGLDTFRPVAVEDIRTHQMHSEFYSISEASAEKINSTRSNNRRVIAVGTTSVRTLETAAQQTDRIQAGSGWSRLFIYPGYRYRCVDAIITNFHLPKSSLLMMISAFWSLEKLLAAYREAIQHQYRFYSYGDAMFLF